MFLIENIWIVAAIVIALILLAFKIFGKTMGAIIKVVLVIFIILAICLALGLTTGEELKETFIAFVEKFKDYDFEDYKNDVINSSTAEQFIK